MMMIRKLLKLIVLCFILYLIVPQTPAKSAEVSKVTVKEYIVKHSLDLGIDPALGLSIAKLESGFKHETKSPYGAVGVFQLMPQTAKNMGFNPWNVSENIKAGLVYYQMMYSKFGSMELALAAYNAGPGNVSKYKGMPPFAETKKFVSNIISEYNYQKKNPDPLISQVKQTQQKKIKHNKF